MILKSAHLSIIFALFIVLLGFAGFNQYSGNSAFAGEILETGKKVYSENNEELIIRDFFNDRRGGIFVDVGSAHYMNASTTYYLEKYLDWSGLAVDALGEFKTGYLENRPKTKFCNFIVTDHSGNMETFYELTDNKWYSSANKEFVEGVRQDKQGSIIREIYVPTITLTELLERNGISQIDFLSMDIEEGEPAALAGFDIIRFKPELVCIEAHGSHKYKIMKYFIRHGYELIDKFLAYDKENLYFKPKH